ncbi:xylanase [Poronia punctata]|nr:xylanase [Poronia punctata]
MLLKSLSITLAALSGALAFPIVDRQCVCDPPGIEIYNPDNVYFSRGANGQFSVQWNNPQPFIIGGGWNPGTSSRKIGFSTTWSAEDTPSWVGIFGMTYNPVTEYYVVETYGLFTPAWDSPKLATFESDDGTYDIHHITRTNQTGNSPTLNQWISVRQEKRSNGTVTIENHFNAWSKQGIRLGVQDFQGVAIGVGSGSGYATLNVFNG